MSLRGNGWRSSKPIHMPIVRVVEQHFGIEAMPESKEEQAVKEEEEAGQEEAGSGEGGELQHPSQL